MEKKQLFDSSLVDFHPEIFDSYLQISVDIGDNDYTSNFSIDQTITVDDDFINNYNNTPINSVGVLAINMTYNGDQTIRHIMNFVKGSEEFYANHIRKGFIYCISINNINTVDKTIDLTISSRSDNTVVRLTTTVNGLTDLIPGDFNETVTLTAEEYNDFKEIPIGKVFTLSNSDTVVYFTIKNNDKSFRANRYYIDVNSTDKFLVSFLIELGENNQATFKGNVAKLMDFNNYLAKDNTTEYTPTSDYNPATKKYVDDNAESKPFVIEIPADLISFAISNPGVNMQMQITSEVYNDIMNLTSNNRPVKIKVQGINLDESLNVDDTYFNSIGYMYISNNRGEEFNILFSSGDQLIFLNPLKNNDTDYRLVLYSYNYIKTNDIKDNLASTSIDGFMSKEDKTKLDNTPVQKILTESEYAALGTTPETDNILYFVTPD